MFEMITLGNNTRIRKDHNTFAEALTLNGAVIGIASDVTVQGDQIWIAPADGAEVKQGDKWLHLTSPHVGWMAFTHKGLPICKDLKEITDVPPIPTPISSFDVTVHMDPLLGITSVNIFGDETKPFNILLNDRVIWP